MAKKYYLLKKDEFDAILSRLGLNVTKLASRINVNRATMNRWLSQQRIPMDKWIQMSELVTEIETAREQIMSLFSVGFPTASKWISFDDINEIPPEYHNKISQIDYFKKFFNIKWTNNFKITEAKTASSLDDFTIEEIADYLLKKGWEIYYKGKE
ncbi:MAG: hypothetical protein HQK49_01875 [Oligoflexia bacterium]|nr:hypothetical protein [Oligoflexia bacterium]